jgi:hypothetical protein
MNTDVWQFLCGCLGGNEPKHPFFAVENIELANAGRINSYFCVYHEHQWYTYSESPEWTAIAMTATRSPDDTHWVVIAMDQAGMIWELHPHEVTESFSQILPERLAMTNLATINNTIYACGMGRVLMRRNTNGEWIDISAPWPNTSEGVIGFTCVSGLNNSLIYAIGWQGEIWSYCGEKWIKEDSPTNANLNALAVDVDGTAYIVGDNGAMLKGSQGCWEVINSETDLNLTDVCIHMGDIYVCSDFEVYRLAKSGLELCYEQEDEDVPQTCLKLFSAGLNGLYSMGSYDVFLFVNNKWCRLA